MVRSRPCRSLAATQDVSANDIEPICVKWSAWTYEVIPPARCWLPRTSFAMCMCVACQCVAYQDRVARRGVQVPPSFIGDFRGDKFAPTFKYIGPVGCEVKELSLSNWHVLEPGTGRGRGIGDRGFGGVGCLRHCCSGADLKGYLRSYLGGQARFFCICVLHQESSSTEDRLYA